MKSEHEKANEKTAKPSDARTSKSKVPTSEVPTLPASTTSRAEEIRTPSTPIPESARKAGESKLAGLQKEYDDLANRVRKEGDPTKRGALLSQKLIATRAIDTVKREHGID